MKKTGKDDDNLRSSILDRFSSAESGGRSDARQSISQMMDSVKRDLENLLNTRFRVSTWPPTLDELERSLVNYGVPDFAGVNMSSPADRQLFRQMVEEAIRIHEPRFLKVRVEIVDSRNRLDRTLRFRIDGLLRAFPDPAEVKFDSTLDPKSHQILVSSLQ
jgi:type VI secretion system protein ImpF